MRTLYAIFQLNSLMYYKRFITKSSTFGLVFGFAKYKIKDCGYVGVSFGHGLYDFLNILVRMFIV